MSNSSGINGWSNPSKAKKAYMRRHGHGMKTVAVGGNTMPNHAMPVASAPLRLDGGLASISEQLYDRVYRYHAQLGSPTQSALFTLEERLLDDAEATACTGDWEEALNIFTHALAATEKLRATPGGDTPTAASTQACIVMQIGNCLHHLGELESARAYYEEAIASIKRIRQPSYERWFTAALGRMSGVPPPDVSHTRIQFLKGRLHDLEFGRAPEGEYRGEMGGRWTSLARRMAEEGGGGGGSRQPAREEEEEDYYYGGRRHDPDEELDDEGYFDGVADDDTVSQPSSPSSGENAKAIAVPPPPSSSRAAALMAAANTRAGNSEGVLFD